MNISSSLVALAYPSVAAEPRIALTDSREFASRLTIGQIIKGRVLLQYDSNRYLVAFDGRERIVDSSVPLETGDILRGRVIAIGDRVELQRVADDHAGDSPRNPSNVLDASQARAAADPRTDLDALFARYQAELPPGGRDLVLRTMRASPDKNIVMLAALTLARLGLPQNEVLLQAITTALKKIPATHAAESPDHATSVSFGPDLTTQLRELVRQALSPPPSLSETNSAADAPLPLNLPTSAQREDMSKGKGNLTTGQLGNLILNAQSGGSVAHRIGTLPLIVNDRLVEVNVAVFDHERDPSPRSDTRHRALVFVLKLEQLGLVEVSATIADERVRVRISQHADALRQALAAAGWSVDEVVYETLGARTSNAAVGSIVEHVIAQDSVNRLV
jgi:hypothetical protein